MPSVCHIILLRNFICTIKTLQSRVIVTDDYNRYLRHFQLRQSQRVVQLWHACGAFKKFGQRGTNMSIAADHAYHVQYNMVTVSSDRIRSIYADAFDIDVHKGKRRWDVRERMHFYDEKLMDETKQKVYADIRNSKIAMLLYMHRHFVI